MIRSRRLSIDILAVKFYHTASCKVNTHKTRRAANGNHREKRYRHSVSSTKLFFFVVKSITILCDDIVYR